MKLDYEELKNYPEILNKEQLRTVCHISKRTALYLLQSGLIKAKNTGKKTRCWAIRKEDVIRYAKDCEEHPFRYRPPENWYIYGESSNECEDDLRAIPDGDEFQSAMQRYFKDLLEPEQDVLGVEDAARITGYGYNTILRWIHKGRLKTHSAYRKQFFIPKVFLLDLLISKDYNNITQKCPRHLTMIREICDAVYFGEY